MARKSLKSSGEVAADDGTHIGRPTKLTPDVQSRILQAIRCGLTYERACLAAGIGETTFYRWKAQGEAGEDPFREFWEMVTCAGAEGEHALASIVIEHAPNDWRAAMAVLKARHPDRWSDRVDVKHEGEVRVTATGDLADAMARAADKILPPGGS